MINQEAIYKPIDKWSRDDLISRRAAIKEIEPIRYCGDFISALIHLPTVDAVPVVHGRWIFHEENGPMNAWLTCSMCGKESGIHEGNYYCHWCGAKMDGEQEGK